MFIRGVEKRLNGGFPLFAHRIDQDLATEAQKRLSYPFSIGFPHQGEKGGRAWLELLRQIFHELVIDADIREGSGNGTCDGSKNRPDQRAEEDAADDESRDAPGESSLARRFVHLVLLH